MALLALAGGASTALGGLLAGNASSSVANPGGPFRAAGVSSLQAFIDVGGNPREISRDEFRRLGPSQAVRVGKGKNRRFFALPTAQEREQAALAKQERQADIAGQAFRSLQGLPFADALFGDATGSSARDRLAPAFANLGERALGSGALAGVNIADPNVQASLFAPSAINFLLAERGLAADAAGRAANLTLGAGSAVGNTQPLGQPFFTSNFFNNAQLAQNANVFNASQRTQAQGAQAGFLGGLGQSFFTGSGIGGFSPGG